MPDIELEYPFDTSNSSLNNKKSDKLLILDLIFSQKFSVEIPVAFEKLCKLHQCYQLVHRWRQNIPNAVNEVNERNVNYIGLNGVIVNLFFVLEALKSLTEIYK